jgi:hypothetical protein
MRKILVALMLVSLFSVPALAVNMTANDTNSATTSFNSDVQLHWNPAGAPSAGNNYSTKGFLLRSPTVAGSYTFAGDTLTVGGGTGGGVFVTGSGVMNNNSFIAKVSGLTIQVNNLILDASYLRDGNGNGQNWAIAGNIAITSNGGGFANQCTFNVNSAISGSGKLYIADNGNGDASRVTIINSALNTYNGSIQLNGNASAARSRLTFSDNSLMNFVIGASGVNNSISGTGTATFAGDFNFNLTGAGTNVGDSWKIASVMSQTFGITFTVAGFANTAATDWRTTANGANYLFSTNTGILKVVPEPASMLILGLGSLALLRKKR